MGSALLEKLDALATDGSNLPASVELLNGADIKPEPIRWVWPGWLAAGKFHVLAGAPGTGKTSIALALAATITAGGRWPDGTRAAFGNVMIWSGEDDAADTLAPRLIASGADMSRVFFVGSVREAGESRPFDPSSDLETLTRAAAKIGDVSLLIADPVVSAVAGDSHKNTEVRRGLQPLVDLGARLRCAVLGISHFTKGTAGRDPVERVTGSIAFGALARVVLAAAKLPDDHPDGPGRIFCRSKSNIGPDDGGFRYDLRQSELEAHPGIFTSSVLWGDAMEGSARELLGQAEQSADPAARSELDDALEFLENLLSDGPVPSKIVRADCEGAGHSWATVRRAQKVLGVEATRDGGIGNAGKWTWRLPPKTPKALKENLTCSQKSVSMLEKSEHLRGEIIGDAEVF
ncbi:AAA family ATPase [Methylococcus sp. EFPC2]|uniref:AAA family ATPase n=1 Tax=Methylococcus sp. EFPC2 TaxID=2812648 RepID=UPI001967ECC6|nr:AAA family ATPase [Methylococcus sp. EFPC2]QSA98617.1 AAA family ATPase [Methylococcus sp. EFPC2]